MRVTVNRIGLLMACWLVIVAVASGQTAGQEIKFQGLITARNGADMTVKTAKGNMVVQLTDATKVEAKEGVLHIRKKEEAVMGLIPGLKVDVNAVGAASGPMTAKSITFSPKDLQQAQAIQAGLQPTQQQVQKTTAQTDANKQAIQADNQKIATLTAEQTDLAKRFGELTDYDVKKELTVFFDTGKADVSASGKKELDTIAQQAKALTGYLIEVEGFASSTGKASLNETLSLERSQNVVDYLTQSAGISPLHVLAPSAMGTSDPVASNETAAGQKENQRVVVKVMVNRGLSKQ